MLYPAQLYKEELKRKLIGCWYKPEYDWYFLGEYREFTIPDNTDWRRDFVHLNNDGEVDGFFSYHYDTLAQSLSQFGLVAFSSNKRHRGLFVKDCLSHIESLINKGVRRIEWWAIADNPVNKTYEKLIHQYGGSVVGYLHECNYFEGKYHDTIVYEILFNKKGE